jgi:hypothetical protein
MANRGGQRATELIAQPLRIGAPLCVPAWAFPRPLFFQIPAVSQERVDLGIVDRIKAEAFERSKVMETLRNLSDVHGPRLTGSPGFEDAARWAMGELNGYGLDKVHLEEWGPFGRAWTLEQSSLELIEPRYAQLTAVPLAWSASSNGAVTGDLVLAPLAASFRDGPKKYGAAIVSPVAFPRIERTRDKAVEVA